MKILILNKEEWCHPERSGRGYGDGPGVGLCSGGGVTDRNMFGIYYGYGEGSGHNSLAAHNGAGMFDGSNHGKF